MKIVTSLSFQGECREAFEFYARVLGGRITAAFEYGDAPPGMPIAEDKSSWLMHCWLEVGDQALMGADMDAEWAPNIGKPKNGFDVTLHTDDIDEGRRWFEQLSEGGRLLIPIGPPSRQQMVRIMRRDGKLQHEVLGSFGFVPLVSDINI